MAPLAAMGTVIAYDRPSSGLTARPMPGDWKGRSPYGPEAQADLSVHLLDALGARGAILVGNSAASARGAATPSHRHGMTPRRSHPPSARDTQRP